MDTRLKKAIMDRARDYLQSGWHCSEGILLAAGAHYLPDALPNLIKIAAPFSGGVGGTQEDLCGAFSGGLMVIGALHGREHASDNDDHCLTLTKQYRERFLSYFGSLRCKDLREEWVGKPGQTDCAELTAQAVGLLVEVIEG
jgi:C_GCAxxG_C_C family probable redox protein